MATATLATAAGLLKEVYENRIVNQLRTKAIGWKRIQSSSAGVTENAGGKYVDFPIKVGRNQGVSYRNERELIGRPGRATFDEVHVDLKYGYGRMRITGQAMKLAQTKAQAFASVMTEEANSLRESLQRDMSRIFYGDSSGLLTPVFDDAGAADSSFQVTDTYWLEKLMDIDLRVMSSGALGANMADREIATVTKSTGIVTVNPSTGLPFDADNTYGVYRQGNYMREPQGLKSIVASSGSLYGVDPAQVDQWRSTVDTTGGALSESAMIKLMDDIAAEGGEGPTAIFTTLGVRRAYHNLLVQQRSFVNAKTFEGGLRGLEFNYADREIPLVADPDLRETGVAYFINENDLKIYHTGDWAFDTQAGSMWNWVADYDEYQAMMKRYWQIGAARRNSHGKMTGIIEN